VLSEIRKWRTVVTLRPTRTNHFDERYRVTYLAPEAAKAFWQHPGIIYFVEEQERVDREAEERMRRWEAKRERKLEEEREEAKTQREDGEVEQSMLAGEEEGGRRTPMDMHWEPRCCSLKRVDDDDW
jgi:flagellar biosynthesis/type III secretory pathway protein FliH